MSSCRFAVLMFLLIVLLALVSVLSLGVGAVFLPPGQVLNALLHPSDPGVKPTDVAIIRDLRLARVLLAVLIGAGLAAAGAAFQGCY